MEAWEGGAEVTVRRERVVSGLCRYADEHPEDYGDFHAECRGNWAARIAHDDGGASTLRSYCDCACHAAGRREGASR